MIRSDQMIWLFKIVIKRKDK